MLRQHSGGSSVISLGCAKARAASLGGDVRLGLSAARGGPGIWQGRTAPIRQRLDVRKVAIRRALIPSPCQRLG